MRTATDPVADPARTRRDRLRRWLNRPVDPLPLVVFRVGFGLLMAAGAVRFVAKGWVATHYLEPDFHFRYPYFGWIGDPPGPWLYLVFALQIVFAAMVAAGVRYRAAAAGFFLCFTYVELLDQTTYLNHYYFVTLVAGLLVLLPLGRWGSIDARRGAGSGSAVPGGAGAGSVEPGGAQSGSAEPERPAPGRWIPLVLRFQVAVVYFYAGVAKLNADWLLEAQPLRIWLGARTGFPLVGSLFDEAWVAYAMSWGGAAFDLSIPLLLVWRRTRVAAYAAVVGFHALTGLLFPIGIFPWVMILAATVFFDGEDFRRAGARLRGWTAAGRRGRIGRLVRLVRPRQLVRPARPARRGPGAGAVARPVSGVVRPSRLQAAVLVAFVAVQLLVPLRHLLYPGSVLWTEEGYRFSWRVMVAEKTGTAFFHVRDPRTGVTHEAVPREHLTPRQDRQFAFQPDMILTFAHHLRDRFLAEHGVVPEVRAEAYVSLNGRPASPLVDPSVDLAAIAHGLGPRSWVFREPVAINAAARFSDLRSRGPDLTRRARAPTSRRRRRFPGDPAHPPSL